MRVYTASKLSSAGIWRDLINEWPEITFVARWPVHHVTQNDAPGFPDDAAHGAVFWQHDYEDVARSDVVLVYGTSEEILRGALVEAGIGIALGKKVIVVGENKSYGTWQYHTSVHRVATLEAARSLLRLMALTT